jgi:hypothetical protein
MNATQHRDMAKIARGHAHVADVCGHLAEERHDRLTAADQMDEREFWAAVAEHHEAMASYEASITPGNDAIVSG